MAHTSYMQSVLPSNYIRDYTKLQEGRFMSIVKGP